tara:strand:+ start:873 stop:1493 length:621 start_codon:yes stop_codon:yes gene_type:complete
MSQSMNERVAKISSISELTPWERGFVESVQNQLKKGYTLSDKQTQTIDNIGKRHDPQEIQKRVTWKESFCEEKRQIAKICAHYYLKAGYFTNLAQNLLDDDDFVPSEKQYLAMCENKYAQKVIKATTCDPKYPVGSVVALRAAGSVGISFATQKALKNTVGVVIDVNEPVVSAANGAKRYKVLPVGSPSVVLVEERWLKKARKKKK